MTPLTQQEIERRARRALLRKAAKTGQILAKDKDGKVCLVPSKAFHKKSKREEVNE